MSPRKYLFIKNFSGIIVKELDRGIIESEFEFQSYNYIHFRTNTPGKSMNPLILPAMD